MNRNKLQVNATWINITMLRERGKAQIKYVEYKSTYVTLYNGQNQSALLGMHTEVMILKGGGGESKAKK